MGHLLSYSGKEGTVGGKIRKVGRGQIMEGLVYPYHGGWYLPKACSQFITAHIMLQNRLVMGIHHILLGSKVIIVRGDEKQDVQQSNAFHV